MWGAGGCQAGGVRGGERAGGRRFEGVEMVGCGKWGGYVVGWREGEGRVMGGYAGPARVVKIGVGGK